LEVPWTLDPHTAAKHRILERYLQAWWPIMLSRFPRATYIEGFAGPGIYSGGEPGSPIIALRTLQNAPSHDTPVDLIFIDRERRCLSMLQAEIATKIGLPVRPGTRDPQLVYGSAATELLPRLDAVDAWSGGVFAFLDSWGNVAVPLDVVRALARPRCEVFVTLGRRFWAQFGSSVADEWDDMFGSREWRRVTQMAGAQAQGRYLTECYRRSLREAGFTYVLDFELVDEKGELFYLIHGTTHSLGVEKMKDALWAVDPVAGAGFRDPRGIEGQQPLGLGWLPDLSPLRPMIIEWLRGGPQSVDAIRQRVFDETVYKKTHASSAIAQMVNDQLLSRAPVGGRVTGGTIVALK
jgi:three-Cys-motif partner protein